MNKVIIMGRMAGDPELRTTQNGTSVTSFTVAVDRPKMKDREQETDWIDVVAWRQTAEFICRYFGKGSPIIVSGTLQSRNFEDKAGQKRKTIEVLADGVEFLPKTKDGKTETKAETVRDVPDDFVVVDGEDVPF